MSFYGLAQKSYILGYARLVCDAVGHGASGCSIHMLVETAAAETLLGDYHDRSQYSSGVGLTQIDLATFNWLKQKYSNHPLSEKIEKKLNIQLNEIQYRELALAPLLSLLFCRLRYYAVRTPIPDNREDRARYWKRYYNTSAGAGSAEDYLSRCEACGVTQLFETDLKRSA